jgi:NADH-quinone oxidoreductase subunit M
MTPNALLPIALILPLVAMLAHAFLGSGSGPAETNRAHARFGLVFQWVYGAVLSLTAWIGFGGSLLAQTSELSLGISRILVQPGLYLDGRNAPFLLLLGMALPLVFTWLHDREGRYGASYYISANLLSLSLAGVFLSDSLLLFYLFWETALVGAYFWIGMHGRASVHAGSVYSALLRFVLVTLLGSLPMLLSIAAILAHADRDPGLAGLPGAVAALPPILRWWVFGGFLLAFAVKLPLLGFHGWLRDTYNVSAPACRAILSALMSKMGAYGLILVLAHGFPEQCRVLAPQLQLLCVAGAVYGGLLCLAQDRLVDILVYSSLSHLSLIGLGVFAGAGAGPVETTGLTGAVFQVFNHGLLMAALFAFDARISKSGESPALSSQSGLRGGQWRLAALILATIFASASLPGLSNFAGEILVLYAAFASSPWFTFLGVTGALITAAALVRAFHRIFFGARSGHDAPGFVQAADLSYGEAGLAVALFAFWLVLGLYPMLFIQPVEKALLAVGALRGFAGLP